jgi:hypothetical protein
MFTYECVLAAVLLTSPAETTPDATEPVVEVLHAALMQAAIDAEVLDAREENLLLTQSRDPAGDLRELQRRHLDLLRAPLVAECRLFPERKVIADLLASNRTYRRDLESRLALDQVHAEELRNALLETDQLYHVWCLLRDARCPFYYVMVRRQALLQLRDLLGPEAYYRGQMPPHVPVWHFPVLR